MAPLHILTARRHSSCLYLLYFILSIGRRQLAPRWAMTHKSLYTHFGPGQHCFNFRTRRWYCKTNFELCIVQSRLWICFRRGQSVCCSDCVWTECGGKFDG